jgi:hypothetical protein
MNPLTHSPSTIPAVTATVYDPQSAIKAELGRLIHAAIINKSFCQKLLKNPLMSIEAGYCGESFHFSPAFKESLRCVRAESVESFCSQLMQIINSQSIAEKALLYYN